MKAFAFMLCLLGTLNLWANDEVIKYRFNPNKNRVEVLKDADVLSVFNSIQNKNIDPQNIDLLVWNIYKAGKPGLYNDLSRLAHKKSLVLLQEGYDDHNFHNFLPNFADYIWNMASSFKDNVGIKTGVVTASTQIPEQVIFVRSPDTEPILKTPKMSLISYYALPHSEPLLVVNIHAINFVLNPAFERQIHKNFDVIAKHKGPVIFAGDFNTWNKYRMQFLQRIMAYHGLTRVPLNSPLENGIDHVYQRGFQVLEAKVLDSIGSSDHLPLAIKLRLGN